MEDTLRDEEFQDWILDALVLILVLMEDTRSGYVNFIAHKYGS